MTLRVTLLGGGTALPDARRGAAGLAVQLGARSWWVDGGPGTLQRSVRFGVDPLTLDGGFFSHHHPDHCAELVGLLFAMRVAGRSRPYHVHAGPGIDRVLTGLDHAFGRWIRVGDALPIVTPLSDDGPGQIDLEDLSVHTRPARHGAGAVHLRFEAAGRSVVWSGDTGPSAALAELAAGCDLLICECGHTASQVERTHLAPEDVIEVGRAARPRQLWLTHLYDHPALPDRVDGAAILRRVRRGLPDVAVSRPQDGARWPT